MKVAFNLSSLAYSTSGIARTNLNYLLNIKVPKKQIKLFSFSKIKSSKLKKFDNIIYFSSIPLRYLNFIWYNFVLPFQLYFNNVDYLISHHRSPILNIGFKSILFVHDFTWKKVPETMKYSNYLLEKYFTPISIKRAQVIIVPTNSIKKEFEQYYPKLKEKCKVIYLASFLKNKKYKNTINKKNFLFVGTIEPRKNLENLLKAYSRLRPSLKKKHNLYIVGSQGWGNTNLEDIILNLNLVKYVKIFKNVNDLQLSKMYKNSLYTILISKYEGYGLPVVESLASNTPVIISKDGSLIEIYQNCGYSVEYNKINKIKNTLNKAVTEKKKYKLLLKKIKLAKFPDWKSAGITLTNLIKKNYDKE